MPIRFCLILSLIFILEGCSGVHFNAAKQDQEATGGVVVKSEPIVIRVTGYAAYEVGKGKNRSPEQRRLMAMRASKLDAFRSMAERVYGTVVSGTSTVKEFVMRDDRFRTMVDSVIRGARVLSVNERENGSFETVLELKLESRFNDCLSKVNQFRYSEDCRLPLPQSRDDQGDLQARSDSSESLYILN